MFRACIVHRQSKPAVACVPSSASFTQLSHIYIRLYSDGWRVRCYIVSALRISCSPCSNSSSSCDESGCLQEARWLSLIAKNECCFRCWPCKLQVCAHDVTSRASCCRTRRSLLQPMLVFHVDRSRKHFKPRYLYCVLHPRFCRAIQGLFDGCRSKFK